MVDLKSISKIWFVRGYPLTGTISSTTFLWNVKRKDRCKHEFLRFQFWRLMGQTFAVEEARAAWLLTH